MSDNTFGLTMIVKNGASAIKETLIAIRDHIDYYTILDTGSTDNTIQIIKEVMGDRPGVIYEEPFVGFDVSRNRCLELHGTKTKWITMLDDTYILSDIPNLKKQFTNSGNYDSFALNIVTKNSYEESIYSSIRVWRTDMGIKYKYRIHEIPVCKKTKLLDSKICYITDNVDTKMRLRSERRREYDIKMLMLHYKEDPKDERILSYLGKYFMNENEYEKSMFYFQKVLENVKDTTAYESALFSAKVCIEYKNSKLEEILKYLFMALKINPNRAETYYYAAIAYFNNGDIRKAIDMINKAIDIPFPVTLESIDKRIYDINIPYIYCFFNIILGYKEKARRILKEKIKMFPRENNFKNLLYSIEGPETFSVTKFNEKHLVFNSGEDESFWKPGTEITEDFEYVSKMFEYAKLFSQRGYAVTFFGKFIKGDENIEGTYDLIDCLDQSKYAEYIQKHFIDVLIVNNHTNNLSFYDNIQKVFLWSTGNFKGDILTVHPYKFAGLISDSRFFIEKMISVNKIPIEKTILTNYPLNVSKIDNIKSEGKIPGRFVYSGTFNQKVDYVLEIYDKLKQQYPEISLVLLATNCPPEIIEKCNRMNDVSIKEKTETTIIQEYKSAEFWIDPMIAKIPTQNESIIAQYCGCFCITNGVSPYQDIIGNRGAIWKDYITSKNIDEFTKYISSIMKNDTLISNIQMKAFNWSKKQTLDLVIDTIVSKF